MSFIENIQQNISNYFLSSEKVAGVEFLQNAAGEAIYLVILEKKKNKAEISITKRDIDSWQTLKKLIGADCPVFLSINTKSIIHRKIEGSSGSESNALQIIFPNAVAGDFYIQQTSISDAEIISIARRDVIDKIITELTNAEIPLLHVSLGPFHAISNTLDYLQTLGSLRLNTHLVLLKENKIIDFQAIKFEENSSSPIRIGENTVDSDLWLAFSLAASGMSEPKETGINSDGILWQQSEFLNKKIFQSLGISLLGIFFIALLLNYFAFSHFQEKNNGLKATLQHKEFLLKQRDTLKAVYQKKEAFLGGTAVGKASKTSFYADQLAASLPSSINFTELTIFPLIVDKNSSQSELKMPRYETDLIKIKGQCKGSVFYNNWKKSVQELFWVKEIHNLYYKDLDEDTGVFELEIRIKT